MVSLDSLEDPRLVFPKQIVPILYTGMQDDLIATLPQKILRSETTELASVQNEFDIHSFAHHLYSTFYLNLSGHFPSSQYWNLNSLPTFVVVDSGLQRMPYSTLDLAGLIDIVLQM
jgi:hypothetical protein